MPEQLHVFKAEPSEYVIASGPEDAIEVYLAHEVTPSRRDYYNDPIRWLQLTDDCTVKIGNMSMTCAEWCKREGRGGLANWIADAHVVK